MIAMIRYLSLYLIVFAIYSLLLSCERRSVTNSLEENFAVIDTTINDGSDSTDISNDDSTQTSDSTNNDVRRVFIEDLSGKRWDITQAVEKYNFDPQRFKYGLGPDAIKPILNPEMLNYWDEEYPASDEEFLVIGINLNGDKRAYPLTIMVNYEIVAVAY
jgi:hypothetical protein